MGVRHGSELSMESRQMGRVPNVAVRKALVAHAFSVPRRQSCRRSAQAARFARHRRGRRCGTRGRVRYNRLAAPTSMSRIRCKSRDRRLATGSILNRDPKVSVGFPADGGRSGPAER
jgi:hypothetical protein